MNLMHFQIKSYLQKRLKI